MVDAWLTVSWRVFSLQADHENLLLPPAQCSWAHTWNRMSTEGHGEPEEGPAKGSPADGEEPRAHVLQREAQRDRQV